MTKLRVLAIDDEPEILELVAELLQEHSCDVVTATSWAETDAKLANESFDVVFSDIHMPGKSGLIYLEELIKSNKPRCPWVFITGDHSPEIFERAMRAGAVDVLTKPLSVDRVSETLDRLRDKNPLRSIMHMIQSISGVKLGHDKKLLVETRVMRRARAVGAANIDEYLQHFEKNTQAEVSELISVLTTHTTEFFREANHFRFLEDHVLGNYKAGDTIRCWSAAASTGQESYSIAICILEFLKKRNLLGKVKVEIFGTDIDANAVEIASEGIYADGCLDNVAPEIRRSYFETAEIEGRKWIRVNDMVHDTCSFKTMNLMTSHYNVGQFDFIFLRNVLIYFSPKDVQEVAQRLEKCLKPEGILFLGHSESISNLKTNFELVGNSVYKLRSQQSHAASQRLMNNSSTSSRVLIVDDSTTVRKLLRGILTAGGMEIAGEAVHPLEAEKILDLDKKIDVITLDIHMPEMDGITYLERLRSRADAPPVVMISSVRLEDASDALRCFDLGAVDYIEKPQGGNLSEEKDRICAVVKSAAQSRKKKAERISYVKSKPIEARNLQKAEFDLILIGSSTGGVEALKVVLPQFPENCPPILVVQHIPAHFSAALAKRLNDECAITVEEATHNTEIRSGHAYIAPGGRQMRVIARGAGMVIEITDDAPVNRHKPSVDYLFQSAVNNLPRSIHLSAAVLTGMGNDGAAGLKKLREIGTYTIAQDEETCVVFGMPKVAIEVGGAVDILPLTSIAYHLIQGPQRSAKVLKIAS